jgi:hypothetical protein
MNKKKVKSRYIIEIKQPKHFSTSMQLHVNLIEVVFQAKQASGEENTSYLLSSMFLASVCISIASGRRKPRYGKLFPAVARK